MKKVFYCLFLSGFLLSCNNSKTEADKPMVKDASDTKPPQSEMADAKYSDMGRQMMQKFESGDIDSWGNMFADNAVYLWSAGDSVAGKKAITDYWKNRRMNVIDSIHFSNDIWLPIKVNQPQKGPDLAGTWLLSWYQVSAKYKTGKSVGFWVHTDYHFDANDKIDRAVQYIDMAPIKAATGK
ncbi:MAG: nuclear transport factor 2 family protein [Flavisolibacter sp.]